MGKDVNLEYAKALVEMARPHGYRNDLPNPSPDSPDERNAIMREQAKVEALVSIAGSLSFIATKLEDIDGALRR